MRREKAIKALVESLPEYSEAIERAFLESEQFGSMCADFETCTKAITRWQNTESDTGQARLEEYEELLIELKREIVGWLKVRGYLDGTD